MVGDLTPELRRRIELTTAVRDTDTIPKVPNAGDVEDQAGRRVQVMHNGVLIEADCYQGPWMTEIIRRLRGHHEPQEEAAFHALVERLRQDEKAPTMLELGSAWAYYSLWLRHEIPEARCVMVEPDPRYLDTGRRNFELNGFTGRFIAGAVGRRHGRTVRMTTESDGAVRRVPVFTVDGLMADEGIERLSLLLCDVQGAEVDALAGAREGMLERRIRFLVISTHHYRITGDPLTHQRCLAVLRQTKAHIITEHSVNESCSGDGLIVASLDPRDTALHVDVSRVRARDCMFGELEWDMAAALSWRGSARRIIRALRPRLRLTARR